MVKMKICSTKGFLFQLYYDFVLCLESYWVRTFCILYKKIAFLCLTLFFIMSFYWCIFNFFCYILLDSNSFFNVCKIFSYRYLFSFNLVYHVLSESSNVRYEGYIHKVLSNEVLIKFNPSFHDSCHGVYSLTFEANRTSFRRAHQAVHVAFRNLGSDWLFPSRVSYKPSQVISFFIFIYTLNIIYLITITLLLWAKLLIELGDSPVLMIPLLLV